MAPGRQVDSATRRVGLLRQPGASRRLLTADDKPRPGPRGQLWFIGNTAAVMRSLEDVHRQRWQGQHPRQAWFFEITRKQNAGASMTHQEHHAARVFAALRTDRRRVQHVDLHFTGAKAIAGVNSANRDTMVFQDF